MRRHTPEQDKPKKSWSWCLSKKRLSAFNTSKRGSSGSDNEIERIRRTGHVWSRDTSRRDDLRPAPAARPCKSIMKVATLEDSLRGANSSKRAGPGAPVRALGTAARSARDLLRGDGSLRSGSFDGGGGGCGGGGAPIRRGISLRGLGASVLRLRDSAGGQGAGGDDGGGRRIRFGRLQFREYDVLAVDHPGVSRGPALGIGWEYDDAEESPTVDEYESSRGPRRQLKEIKLSKKERQRRLLESGVTQEEQNEVVRSIKDAKKRRQDTLDNLDEARSEERKEAVIKMIKIWLGMRKRGEKAVDELWDMANQQNTNRSMSTLLAC